MNEYDVTSGSLLPTMVTFSSVFDQDVTHYGALQSGIGSQYGWRPASDSMYEWITVSISEIKTILFLKFVYIFNLGKLGRR